MTYSKQLGDRINKLIAKNCAFALWSVPGNDDLELLISCSEAHVYPGQFSRLNGKEGFVFAPYKISANTPLVLLRPDVHKTGIDAILKLDIDELNACKIDSQIFHDHFVIDKPQYLKDIRKTVETLKSSKLSKAIVSRIIPVDRGNESIGELFLQLLRQTPNAFVYLVNLPQAGLWMGATPEILVKSEAETLETVSLAGTQPRQNTDDYAWKTKEIEEQAFVSRYLLDVFYRFNIHPYTTRGPETLESGKVAHLVTSFQFAKDKLASKLGDFVAELHPTPAVCGYPKNEADQFIQTIEKHDRRYYSGFVGPWQLNRCVGLFVNLRCMEITPNQYMLYSGGGITSRSVAEYEWEETNNKAATLLSAIEAVQKK